LLISAQSAQTWLTNVAQSAQTLLINVRTVRETHATWDTVEHRACSHVCVRQRCGRM